LSEIGTITDSPAATSDMSTRPSDEAVSVKVLVALGSSATIFHIPTIGSIAVAASNGQNVEGVLSGAAASHAESEHGSPQRFVERQQPVRSETIKAETTNFMGANVARRESPRQSSFHFSDSRTSLR